MIVNRVLNEVFSAKYNVPVMRVLKNSLIGMSGREISRSAGISPKACLNSLTILENLGIVNRIRGGRDHLFFFNRDHYLVKEILIYTFDVEEAFFTSILSELKSGLKKFSRGAYIFGSVARREETIESDLDLCIVYDSAGQKNTIEKIVAVMIPALTKRYGIVLSPFYISASDFNRRIKNKKPPIVQSIKNQGILGLP